MQEEKLKKFKGKNILIVGLGLQGGGVGLANFFSKLGANVTVTDLKKKSELKESISQLKNIKKIKLILGKHRKKDFLDADLIIKGPSVPPNLLYLLEAKKKGIEVTMEIPLFFQLSPTSKIIGVTGTRGKSTTTLAAYTLLKKAGFPVHLGGNVPNISTINLLTKLHKDDWVVLELSSWSLSQLCKIKKSPHIAIFTNIYPDHLNYYKDMQSYFMDKACIFLSQKKNDYLIASETLKEKIEKLKPHSHIIYISPTDIKFPLSLKGEHNKENMAHILALGKVLKIREEKIKEIISPFKGLPYRQEIIGKYKNLIFVNDTTSTTPTATIRAIERFKNEGKIILILGGNSKKLPFEKLISKIKISQKIILLKGSFTQEILPTLMKNSPDKLSSKIYSSLDKAIKEAIKGGLSQKERVIILFSPAATSFAAFKNEFHRGETFNKIVLAYIKNEKKN